MASERLITESRVADFLTDRTSSRHLDPFLGKEATIAEAAADLGLSAPRMSYWVDKLLDLDLVEFVGTRVQSRHRVRLFRSTADSFVFSLDLLTAPDVEVLERYFAPVWRRFLTSLVHVGRRGEVGWQARFGRSGGQAGFEIVPGSGDLEDAGILNAWVKLSLSRRHAASLRRDMRALVERYAALQSPDAAAYWVHAAAVEDAVE